MQVDPDLVAVAISAPITTDSRWGTLVSREELRTAQQVDGLCQRVTQALAKRCPTETEGPGEFDSYLLSSDNILLTYIHQEEDEACGSPFWSVIPRKLRKFLMRYMHDTALAGHCSGSKITKR